MKNKKLFLGIAALVGICLLASCFIIFLAASRSSNELAVQSPSVPSAPTAVHTATPLPPEPTVTPLPPEPTATPLPPTPTMVPQIFNGSGKDIAEVNLSTGLIVVHFTHNGQSNFAIKTLDSNGELLNILANEIGPTDGVTTFRTEDEKYVFDVTADGEWSITLTRPGPENSQPLPVSFTGKGQSVSPFFASAGGLTKFTTTHNGQSNFAIKMLDDQGNLVDIIVNEIGPFEGSTAAGLDAGFYILDIAADGDWSVDIE